ncbi:FAD/NAD(P)-binding protein [Peterkaempfera griseoplana]|uniref:FAD/NAD(P)-binding protein n=1 Tax=Peterkaempfera griseoplana TaxID=66896 RepID=UPI00099E4AAF|nr:FAD/NAD(P)-binding protein [Peterkaempfera griseoplana]BCN13467.1 aspartate monooxygenase [Peterkaempfera griseoplana]
MTTEPLAICLIGAGPRGLSVLERLIARACVAPTTPRATVHVVDPFPAGAGAVWRTDQSQELLMNTVASQITVFTDDSVRIEGPVVPGPALYDWAAAVARDPQRPADDPVLREAQRLGPDSYPTRAFYGAYLRAMFQRVCAQAPVGFDVVVHRTRAVALWDRAGDPGRRQTVLLEDGTRLDAIAAVVLSQGHVPASLTPAERELSEQAAAHGLTYLPPANPADLDLSGIAPGEPVVLRGLGLNFFDHMALLTAGRGGSFVRRAGRLVYRPSGREPQLYAGSRRGIPYHARGENQKGASGRYTPRLLTADFVARLRARAQAGEPAGFGTDVWPLIAREVESVYYGCLLDTRGRRADREPFVELYLAAPDEEHRCEILGAYGIAREDRWDWDRLAFPHEGIEFQHRGQFRSWLLGYLARDVEQAMAGNVHGPVKAALDVLRDLRNEVRLAVDHGGLEGNSHRDDLDGWYTPLNAFLSIGPPPSRIEQMTALIEAGVLELLGPRLHVHVDGQRPAFVAGSRLVPGPPVRATTLIEARLPEPDLRRTADPLMRYLRDTGQAVPFRIDGACGTSHETGGMAVTERPYRLVDAQGLAHPRRFAHGVPTEAVHWVTAAGIRPGVDSVTLGDSDAIAQAVLHLDGHGDARAAEAPDSMGAHI